MLMILSVLAFFVLADALDKLDKQPIPPSTYAELGIGAILLVAALAGWLLGRTFEDD